MFDIDIVGPFEFSEDTPNIIDGEKFGKEKWTGKEWPVVYLIYNETEIYVGETVDAKNRMIQHYANETRRRLKKVILISDGSFNKSVIQDLEAYLIAHIAADSKRSFKLQNGNSGFQKHKYYRSKKYEKLFGEVWEGLRKRKIARQSIKSIENSNIFKYSPYKTLTPSQYIIASDIIQKYAASLYEHDGKTFLVNGGAGTGKTILGVYITKLLAAGAAETTKLDDVEIANSLDLIRNRKKDFKIGIVIPMSNLRTIVKDTFRHTYGLSPELVLSPVDVANSSEKFDLLIVDEAHRLRRRKNLTMYNSFDRANEKLGLDENGTELDWILKKSKSQILFYDSAQSIKPTDIPKEKIEELKYSRDCHVSTLRAQIRCNRGGEKYIDYVGQIFSQNPPEKRLEFAKYDLRLFDDVEKMVKTIRRKDDKFGLCRTVAGYAWDWKTKGKIKPFSKEDSALTKKLIDEGKFDIEINGAKFIWNTKFDGWLSSPNSTNEIGCVHTIQGFDLNYAGVIIGNELRYSEEKGLYIDRKNYKDSNGLKTASDEELLQYILNIYKILFTRGMLGTYVYVCDDGLRNYLRKYLPLPS